MTKFIDDFSKEVYEQTYKFGTDKDINDTHLRVAKDLASIESDPDYWAKEFLKIQENFAFMPGGRITSNAGTGLKGTTYINCFVDGFIGEKQDSMEAILDTLKRQGLILKSEGGYGFNSDVMRPRGAYIDGIANESPGSVQMLDMWDTQSAVITKGSGRKSKGKGKIRKGAQMVTKSVWHPDIEEYITAKQTPGRLTKFNMSVLCDDDFMSAVENHQSWNLEFPDYEAVKDIYNKEWDGNIYLWKMKGYPVKIYKTYKDANELYDLIMKSTYNRNEPGILFVSIINKFNNLWYIEYISATNPCGEQLLPIGGVCLLGSLNLTQFINERGSFDWKKFSDYIPIAVRMLDNVNDITYVPLKEQKLNLLQKRRIGLGILGYGSALLMMNLRYGSQEALDFTEQLMYYLANKAYQASAYLAKEKGEFELFDKEKFLQSEFVKRTLNKETIELIEKYGIRNSHLLSIQPTGNSSVLANNVTGGQEPAFYFSYIRTSMQPYAPEGLHTPLNINWDTKEYVRTGDTLWHWKKEGDENILSTKFNEETWKIDRNRGLVKESIITDYGVRWLMERGLWNEKADWAVNAYNLKVEDHTNTMKVFAQHVDSAMSKTVNLPKDYPYEDFKNLYMNWWKTGYIKGGTTYREGTMTAVLSIEKKGDEFMYHDAPKRPRALEAELITTIVKGQKYGVVIGFLNKKPYEIFAFQIDKDWDDFAPKSNGELIKEKKGTYHYLANGESRSRITIPDIGRLASHADEQVLTRLVSGMLRHGIDPQFIIEQIDKCPLEVVSFGKAVSRIFKKHIKEPRNKDKLCPDCGEETLIHEEGCSKCKSCGYSACK